MYIKQSLSRYRAVLLAAVFLIGAASASNMNLLTWLALGTFFFYFLYPANLYVKGLSDWFDPTIDTTSKLPWAILGWNLPFAVLFFADDFPGVMKGALIAFLVMGLIYGLRHRLKFVRFFGVLGSLLYVTPAVFAYALLETELPPKQLLVAGGFWAAALYIFASLRGTLEDRQTVANNIIVSSWAFVCLCFYGAAGFLAYQRLGVVPAVLAGLLGANACILLVRPGLHQARWPFKVFAFINIAGAFALFVWIVALANPTLLGF